MKTKYKDLRSALEETGYKIYGDTDLLAMKPMEISKEKIELFNVGKYISDDDLEKEYESRGLVPANPFELALSIKDLDKDFIATHWKDANGKWCFAAFGRWLDRPRVDVYRSVSGWFGSWWFGGRCKSASPSEPKNLDLKSLELRLKALEDWRDRAKKIFTE